MSQVRFGRHNWFEVKSRMGKEYFRIVQVRIGRYKWFLLNAKSILQITSVSISGTSTLENWYALVNIVVSETTFRFLFLSVQKDIIFRVQKRDVSFPTTLLDSPTQAWHRWRRGIRDPPSLSSCPFGRTRVVNGRSFTRICPYACGKPKEAFFSCGLILHYTFFLFLCGFYFSFFFWI